MADLVSRKVNYLLSLIDQNKDGVLERVDFERWIDRLASIRGWEPGSEGHKSLEDLFMASHDGFRQLYGGGEDVQMDISGLTPFVVAMAQSDPPEFQMWADGFFKLIDADGDGEIGPGEFRDLMASVSVDATAADESFARIDLNGDGHVSHDEFVELYLQFFRSEDPQAPGSWMWGPVPEHQPA